MRSHIDESAVLLLAPTMKMMTEKRKQHVNIDDYL